jgi:hypothetical protein
VAVGVGMIAALWQTGALASFADRANVTDNAFSFGSVDINTNPTSAPITFGDMAPGDTTTLPLLVHNTGSVDFRYAITASATNADTLGLKGQLALTIRSVDATTPGIPCNDFDGALLFSGDLDGTTGALVGDVAAGAQAGDRTLVTTATEALCFRAQLPLATGNGFQGSTTTATFVFDAEQTANNP